MSRYPSKRCQYSSSETTDEYSGDVEPDNLKLYTHEDLERLMVYEDDQKNKREQEEEQGHEEMIIDDEEQSDQSKKYDRRSRMKRR